MLIATEASLSMRVERIVSSEKHNQFSDRIHEKQTTLIQNDKHVRQTGHVRILGIRLELACK